MTPYTDPTMAGGPSPFEPGASSGAGPSISPSGELSTAVRVQYVGSCQKHLAHGIDTDVDPHHFLVLRCTDEECGTDKHPHQPPQPLGHQTWSDRTKHTGGCSARAHW